MPFFFRSFRAKCALVLGSALLLSVASPAQNFMGLATSPNSGTNRAYLNPALTANTPHRLYINVGAADAHIDNNYVRYRAPYSLLNLLSGNVSSAYRTPGGDLKFEIDYTQEILDGKLKSGTVWGEVRGPALQIKLDESSTLGLSTRLRASAQVQGASQQLLSAVRASLNSGALFSIPSENNQLTANTNTYAELGLTYARTLFDDGEGNQLLLGATVKYLAGYSSGHLVNRGLTYALVTDSTAPGNTALQVNRIDADLGFTTYLNDKKLNPKTLLNPNTPGKGVGLDVGLAFVSQPDPDGGTLRLGVALTDIGGIRYSGEAYDLTQQNVRFTTADFNGVRGISDITTLLRDKFDVKSANSRPSFWSGLPTSLNVSGEFQSAQGAGLAVVWMQDMHAANATAMHQPTLVSVTPRYETGFIGLALPITYLNGSVLVGTALKLGPVWLGSDNLAGLIGRGGSLVRPKGVDVYAGLAFGIGRSQTDR